MVFIQRFEYGSKNRKSVCAQTIILNTQSNLVYALCVTRLKIIYVFIFTVKYHLSSLVNLNQNVENSISVSAKSHQCPHKYIKVKFIALDRKDCKLRSFPTHTSGGKSMD